MSAAAPFMKRRVLHEGAGFRVGRVVAQPVDGSVEVEAPRDHVLALPVAGVFARIGRGRRASVATPLHGVFFPAGQDYRMSFPGAIGDEVLTLQWSPAALDEALPGAAIRESRVVLDPAQMVARGFLARLLARGQADAVRVEELCLGILAACVGADRGEAVRPRSRPGGRDRIDRVKAAVAVAPERKWSLAELARVANLSPWHLAHLFRDEVGIPVHAYVTRARLSKALCALLESDAGITEIAFAAGFASHSHFTARFRATFGATPDALRRRGDRTPAQLRKIVTAR